MTSQPRPDDVSGGGPEQERVDNGLRARTYVPLTDVDSTVGQHLLAALGRARIAAYLGPGAPAVRTDPSTHGATPVVAQSPAEEGERRRLFVASEERVDARTIVVAAVRALGEPEPALPEASDDPLAGLDADAMFDALVADWHVDTHVAIRDAERDLTREDADWRARLAQPAAPEDPVWLDDDHYVPPPPPPLPRLSAPAVIAIVLLAVSIVVLGFGTGLGLPGNFTVVLGIGGILVSGGILLSRLHEHRSDEDDDGSAV